MKTRNIFLMTLLCTVVSILDVQAQDTIWVKYDNRFTENKSFTIAKYDSIEFRMSERTASNPVMKLYTTTNSKGYVEYRLSTLFGNDNLEGSLMFHNPGRILWKPSAFSGVDYTSNDSRWSFKRSKESEHFVLFWEKGFGDNCTNSCGGYTVNPTSILNQAENIWKVYVEKLGFLHPGKSTTDKYKIELYLYYDTEWIANGSGYDAKVGALNVNAWAANAEGGVTVAHEVGHTFQYLVSCDLGQAHGFNYGYGDNASGGNGWWESCAQWQAYKVYPARQFTNSDFNTHLSKHHLGVMHEEWRYQNFFVQDYWCQLHGEDFIGRLWRESNKPEDPIEAYKRLNSLSQEQLNDEMYDAFAHMATWDIDAVRAYAKSKIGLHETHLHKTVEGAWQVDSAYCPQNYGYNIINLNAASGGTVVKANFKGIAGASGYRAIKTDKADYRYGFVAYTKDEHTIYGDVCRDKEGVATLTIPENCSKLFFVVMGAPTQYWRHPWNDDPSDDEQWPYEVTFENTDVYGNFGDYPADYARRDTTVVINAELAYDGYSYTSTRVQYDMAAVSQALGLSTAQLKSVGRAASSNPRFVGVSANGNITTGTTTSTSSNTCYGHWFTKAGNVCGYDNNAAIFAEFYPDKYGCYVGQYPGRLTRGQTYTVRQAIQYTTGGKQYTATMVVNLKVN